MRKILQRNEKVEFNSFIEEFVKIRQKYFTPGRNGWKQSWRRKRLACIWIKHSWKRLDGAYKRPV